MSPPISDFEGFPLTGYEPLGVTFIDLSTGAPTGWYWNFGDGSPTGVDQYPYHTYTGAGTYSVELTSFNVDGSDTETKTDYIDVYADTPSAEFDTNKTSGYTPLGVRFTDLSTSVSPITSWLWTFGDGNTSTSQNPTHTYSHPGSFTVTLTVMNAVGKYDTEIKTSLIRIALGTPTLSTYDRAPPPTDDILVQMLDTGDGDVNLYGRGLRFYIRTSVDSPSKSGFRRPAGPSLIFD